MMHKLNHSGTCAGTRWRIVIAGLALALTACGSDQSELESYIDQIKARPGRGIEPLPEFRPAPSYVYVAGDRRSPFVQDLPQQVPGSGGGIGAPDPDRALEYLERFPIDGIVMRGTLSSQNGRYAVLQDPQGLVHRVTIGNHVGLDVGRITGITESEVQLIETVRDNRGGYMERPAKIGLSD